MFDGNGNWTSDFSAQADRDNGIKILASRFDNIFIADIKESFENCLTKDGQIAPIGNFNMGGQKITNLNNGINDNDAVNMSQFNNAVHKTGDETITGFKTIENNITLKDTQRTIGTINKWAKRIQFTDSTGARIARLQPRYVNATTSEMGMYASNGLDTEEGIWVRNDGSTYAPASDANGSIVTTTGINKAQNGYVKLGNGLIIQYGKYTYQDGKDYALTFPTPFTSTNYQITFGHELNENTPCDFFGAQIRKGTKTTTGCTIYNRNASNSITSWVTWIAIGY